MSKVKTKAERNRSLFFRLWFHSKDSFSVLDINNSQVTSNQYLTTSGVFTRD